VLKALSDHFNLGLSFEYIDSSSLAKEQLPNLKDCKLKTLVKHFGLPAFKHHDATEDAIACAKIFLKLLENGKEKIAAPSNDKVNEFKGLIMGILADDEVNYKETYELLYWLEDHNEMARQHQNIYLKTKEVLEDNHLDKIEAMEMKALLYGFLESL